MHSFWVDNKTLNFPSQFCPGSMPNKFDTAEISFEKMCVIFQVDYNVMDKSDILYIHKY